MVSKDEPIYHVDTSLEAVVELALSATTSQNLSLNNQLFLA